MKVKHIRLLLSISLFTVFYSCDRMDKNGNLEGNWQMTTWIDKATGDTIADKTSYLYYTVRLEMIQFQQKYNPAFPCLAYFEHNGEEVILGKAYQNTANSDSLVSISYLRCFGVSADGRFHVDYLSDEHLTLSNTDNILYFRKH